MDVMASALADTEIETDDIDGYTVEHHKISQKRICDDLNGFQFWGL